jgi:outer membrane protein assembly factor BamB
MKHIYLIIIFGLSFANLSISQPTIKWWFETKDASAGQTSAGDIDSDGKLELVFGCYRNDSCIYVLNSEDGSLLWKYNTGRIGAEGCNDVATLVYDIDGDGVDDVIVPSSCNPTTYCFDGKTGNIKWETPTRGSDSPPSIADINGDGKLEILHGEFGGYVICLNAEDGKKKWEIPVDLNSWIQTAPTIVDLNNDGQLDFVVATWNAKEGDTNKVYAYNGKTHEKLWEFPVNDVIYHGTSVTDLDFDGKPELLIGDYSGEMFVINGEDGSLDWSYKFPEYFYIGGPVSIADLDSDGFCEIVFSGWYKMLALRSDGTKFWEYEIPEYSSSFRGSALSDVDNDGKPDVIFGTDKGHVIALKGTSGSQLWDVNLAEHYGKDFNIDNAPIIADFDKDGILDLFIVGGHMEYPAIRNNYGRAYCLSIGKGTGPDWLMFQNNQFRNGSICTQPTGIIDSQKATSIPKINFNSLSNQLDINFNSEINGKLNIDLYDILGNEIINFENGNLKLGNNIYNYNLNDYQIKLAPGIYLLSLNINEKKYSKLLIIIK